VRKRASSLVGAVVVLAGAILASGPGPAGEIVKLTVTEEAGFDRTNEPVTMAFPCPRGWCRTPPGRARRPAGRPCLPGQRVSRDWLDGSRSSGCPSPGSSRSRPSGPRTLAVTPARRAAGGRGDRPVGRGEGRRRHRPDRLRQVHGPRREVQRISAAWFDPTGSNKFEDANQVIGGEGGGKRGAQPRTRPGQGCGHEVQGLTARPRPTPRSTMPRARWSSRSSGPARSGQGDRRQPRADGKKALDYIVRFYAYAGSPVVRISHTFVCAPGRQSPRHALHERPHPGAAHPPGRRQGGVRHGQGNRSRPSCPRGSSRPTATTSRSPPAARSWRPGAGQEHQAHHHRLGRPAQWRAGPGRGIKWFWQMCPSRWRSRTRASSTSGLYPSRRCPAAEAYMGQSRTHYLTLVFHDGRPTPEALNAIFAGQNRPLFAWRRQSTTAATPTPSATP